MDIDPNVITAQLAGTLATITRMKRKPGKHLCKQICPPNLCDVYIQEIKKKSSEDAGKKTLHVPVKRHKAS